MRVTDNFVFFYGSKDHMSNFYRAPFVFRGIRFLCGEQYLMYRKAELFGDLEVAEQILRETNPVRMKALGRQVRNYEEGRWSAQRPQIAFEGLLAKYAQNPDIEAELLATGYRIIAEASPRDRIWGIGLGENHPFVEDPSQWRGANILGQALMRVREHLLDKENLDHV